MASAAISNSMKRRLATLLDDRAAVYTRGAGGTYTVTATSGLKCSLQAVNRSTAQTAPDRAELATLGVLYWQDYTMPEHAQIAADSRPGERYNVQAGTVAPDVGPGNVTVMYHCDVVRAK